MALTNTSPNTILLDVGSDSKLLEAPSVDAGDIYPGALLEYDDNGNFQLSTPVGAGEPFPIIIAIENTAEGMGLTDPYETGDKVYAVHLRSGDLFQGILHDSGAHVFGLPVGTSSQAGRFTSTTITIANSVVLMGENKTFATGGLLAKLIVK